MRKYKILEEDRKRATQVSIILNQLDFNEFPDSQKAKAWAQYLYKHLFNEVKNHNGKIQSKHIKLWLAKKRDKEALEIARTGKLKGSKVYKF